jgi:hypothetical protein
MTAASTTCPNPWPTAVPAVQPARSAARSAGTPQPAGPPVQRRAARKAPPPRQHRAQQAIITIPARASTTRRSVSQAPPVNHPSRQPTPAPQPARTAQAPNAKPLMLVQGPVVVGQIQASRPLRAHVQSSANNDQDHGRAREAGWPWPACRCPRGSATWGRSPCTGQGRGATSQPAALRRAPAHRPAQRGADHVPRGLLAGAFAPALALLQPGGHLKETRCAAASSERG